MTRRKKNLVGAMIRKRGATKLIDTKPELALQEICKKELIEFELGFIQSYFGDDGKSYEFKPDVRISSNILIEADGEYHDTAIQKRKTAWRDRSLIQMGYRVLHIPASLLVAEGVGDRKAYWPYVAMEIKRFIEESDLKSWTVIA